MTAGGSYGTHWTVRPSSSATRRGACPDPAHRFSPKLTHGCLHRAGRPRGCLASGAQLLIKLFPPLIFQICPLPSQDASMNLSSKRDQTGPVLSLPGAPKGRLGPALLAPPSRGPGLDPSPHQGKPLLPTPASCTKGQCSGWSRRLADPQEAKVRYSWRDLELTYPSQAASSVGNRPPWVMRCGWQGEEQGRREAAWRVGSTRFIVQGSGLADTRQDQRLRRRLAWPGSAGRTAAFAPQAPAGSGGSGPGRGRGHCVNRGLNSPTALGSSTPP